jgi:hypothetical protein
LGPWGVERLGWSLLFFLEMMLGTEERVGFFLFH